MIRRIYTDSLENLSPGLAEEIRKTTKGAQLYKGGPAVDYSTTQNAYAVNITLMYGNFTHDPTSGICRPTSDTEILIVQRASGDGKLGSWSGVSGYLDRPDLNDPLRHAVVTELREEVGLKISRALTDFSYTWGNALLSPEKMAAKYMSSQ
jgi:hypothetical protein